jgi:hypothetical protein
MLNDPLMLYELFKAEQRDLWREAERSRHAREATPDQAGQGESVEVAPLTGLVERVLQNVWKRLGLPAREPGLRPEDGRSGRSSGTMRPAASADGPLFDLH